MIGSQVIHHDCEHAAVVDSKTGEGTTMTLRLPVFEGENVGVQKAN